MSSDNSDSSEPDSFPVAWADAGLASFAGEGGSGEGVGEVRGSLDVTECGVLGRGIVDNEGRAETVDVLGRTKASPPRVPILHLVPN